MKTTNEICGIDAKMEARTYRTGDKVVVHTNSNIGDVVDVVRSCFIQQDSLGDSYPAVVLTTLSWAAVSDIEPYESPEELKEKWDRQNRDPRYNLTLAGWR